MKNFYILLFFMQSIFSQNLFACETGYACSIQNLQNEQLQNERLLLDTINKMFEKGINEYIFFSDLNEKTNYDDLFIYKHFIEAY